MPAENEHNALYYMCNHCAIVLPTANKKLLLSIIRANGLSHHQGAIFMDLLYVHQLEEFMSINAFQHHTSHSFSGLYMYLCHAHILRSVPTLFISRATFMYAHFGVHKTACALRNCLLANALDKQKCYNIKKSHETDITLSLGPGANK